MKKFILSLFTILSFAGFGFYRWWGLANGGVIYVAPTSIQASLSPAPVATTSGGTPPPQFAPTATLKPTATPTPKKNLGQYKDGQYTGSVADAYYGNIQVQAVIQGGRVVDIKFLQYPNDRSTSRYINSQAMPMLTQEAIQTQNAKVNIISGATDSSGAFRESLGVALAKAK